MALSVRLCKRPPRQKGQYIRISIYIWHITYVLKLRFGILTKFGFKGDLRGVASSADIIYIFIYMGV